MTPEQQGIFITGVILGVCLGWLIGSMAVSCLPEHSNDFAYKQFSDLKSNPISLMDFAIALSWSGKKAEKWLDARVKEFGGIKEKQNNGDQWYYLGEAATKLIESYDRLINTGTLKETPEFKPKKPVKYIKF